MLDGSCCELCGQYFKHPYKKGIYTHKYPVVCWECWDDLSEDERKDYQRAEVKTFYPMKTRIEVYEIARPTNVAASGEWNRRLSTAEIRKEIRNLMRWLDPQKFTHRIFTE